MMLLILRMYFYASVPYQSFTLVSLGKIEFLKNKTKPSAALLGNFMCCVVIFHWFVILN